VDAATAQRIGDYHLTALRLMTAAPGADPERQSLLSAEELEFQLEGLAGPRWSGLRPVIGDFDHGYWRGSRHVALGTSARTCA
jgi:hypothetical protein